MTKLLMIDNYDSFTYNLVQYFGELKAEVFVIKNDELNLTELINFIKDKSIEKIVISPGPCSPKEAGISVEVIQNFANKLPILGVCLGHQAVGFAFGGNIIKAPKQIHGKVSKLSHNQTGLFKNLPQKFTINRYHSLIIDEETLPNCLEITAKSEDGIIQGIKHKYYQIEGLQFHPESILTEHGHEMLENFLNLD